MELSAEVEQLERNLKSHENDPKYSDRQVWANTVDLEQFDQCLHCLPLCSHVLGTLLHGKTTLFQFQDNYAIFEGCPNFSFLQYHLGQVMRKCWLVVLRLNVPVNNFSVMSGRSHRFLGNLPVLMRKCVLCHMRTTKAQISLRIRAVWSAPLLFAPWIV